MIDVMLFVGTAIFVIGLAACLVVRDVIRRIVALNIASGGVMIVLIAVASRGDGAPDPVPQALVLTGIVVMAAITGLALAIARRIENSDDENEAVPPEGGADE